MKSYLKFSALLLSAFVLFRCSDDELVQPQEPFEDLTTSASAYQDEFLTIKVTTSADDQDLRFVAYGEAGKISVNWGDGKIEKRLVSTSDGTFEHRYDRHKNYTVTISGDVENLTTFGIFAESLKIESIHLGGMPMLGTLYLQSLGNGPAYLNLSKNRVLRNLRLTYINNLADVVMPPTNQLREVQLNMSNQLSTAEVDHIIGRVYDAATANSTANGTFLLWGSDVTGEEDIMVGPPSSYSINKLKTLKHQYNWRVEPLPEQ